MRLQRNEQQEPQTSNQPSLNLEDLWEEMLAMRQDSAELAEDKYQVALLLKTVSKLCSEQTAFLSEAKSMLDMININQVEMCCQLEQYKKDIADDAKRLLASLYNSLKDEQKKIFEAFWNRNTAAIDKMTADAKSCAECINKAVNHAENATKKLFRITKIADLVYYIAPDAVLADLLFRVIHFFA